MKTSLALMAAVSVAVAVAPLGGVAAEPPAPAAQAGSSSSAAVSPAPAESPVQVQVSAPGQPAPAPLPPAPSAAAKPAFVPSAIAPAVKSSLSDSEKLEKSAEAIARMKAGLKQVLARVEDARNEKDVIKLNCINEKLTQIKGLLKVAEQSDVALNEAIASKLPSADAEFAKVTIARGKVDGLKADADQCIGQLAYVIDEKTTVDVSQPTNLPNVDGGSRLFGAGQTGLVPAAAPPAERPVPASP
jgi:hypothetical protein